MGTLTDRIEELLAALAAENEDEEREDVLALPSTQKSGDGGQTAGETVPERSGRMTGEAEGEETGKGGPVWTVRGAAAETGQTQRAAAAEQTVRTGQVLQPPMGGELSLAGLERTAGDGAVDPALKRVGRPGPARTGLEQAGLKGLYRQTVRGLRPAAPALPPEQAGKTARAQEPGGAASLAVDELDRAVRRDSRRYDGGMSIY